MTLTQTEPGTLYPLTSDPRCLRHLQVYEGCPYAALEAPDGDILFHYGGRAMFHLSADLHRLRCGFARPGDPASLRVLLDTVLWTVSLAHGLELLHASAVRTAAGLVAFCTHSGGGKSSLAAEYLHRGAALFADDVVALGAGPDAVTAYPGPPVMNLSRELHPRPPAGGVLLARFGDEQWVLLDRGPQLPERVAAIVIVSRAPGQALDCRPIDATSLTLMPLAITLPHMTSRELARFELFGQLAATTPVFSLTADPSVPPAELADAVDAQLRSRSGPPAGAGLRST